MSATGESVTQKASGLDFVLCQTSQSPPAISITLKNSNSYRTYAFLTWATPLDPMAPNLGIFRITDQDTGEVVQVDGPMISRLMPPPREDIISIAPGQEISTEVKFDKPWMPQKRPAKYGVELTGVFDGLWDKPTDVLNDADILDYTSSPFHGTPFRGQPTTLDMA